MSTQSAQEILDQLNELEEDNQNIAIKAEASKDGDRRWIARVILYPFAASFILIIVLTFILFVFDADKWKEPAEALLAIVAQVWLPIVTLVVGFYFGKDA